MVDQPSIDELNTQLGLLRTWLPLMVGALAAAPRCGVPLIIALEPCVDNVQDQARQRFRFEPEQRR